MTAAYRRGLLHQCAVQLQSGGLRLFSKMNSATDFPQMRLGFKMLTYKIPFAVYAPSQLSRHNFQPAAFSLTLLS